MSRGKPILTQFPQWFLKALVCFIARLIIPRKQLNQLYFSFEHSYLNYANIAWGSTQKTKLSNLYRQQKHAIRLLSFKDQFTHSRPIFKEIGALNRYEINIFNILCLMFKCKKKACPKAFENLFTLKPKNKYQLKRSCIFLEPFCKSKFSQLCINYRGPHLWNTVVLRKNTDLEQFMTLKLFKETIRPFLKLKLRCWFRTILINYYWLMTKLYLVELM